MAADKKATISRKKAGKPKPAAQNTTDTAPDNGKRHTSAAPDGQEHEVAEEAAASASAEEVQSIADDRYLRLRAEFDNYIKRTARERLNLLSMAAGDVIRSILPVLDDLERTVDHAGRIQGGKSDQGIIKGIKLITEKFEKILESEGLEIIQTVGKPFDPQLHDAILRQASEDQPEGIILEQYESGYIYRDRVIRHAKVIVSGGSDG